MVGTRVRHSFEPAKPSGATSSPSSLLQATADDRYSALKRRLDGRAVLQVPFPQGFPAFIDAGSDGTRHSDRRDSYGFASCALAPTPRNAIKHKIYIHLMFLLPCNDHDLHKSNTGRCLR